MTVSDSHFGDLVLHNGLVVCNDGSDADLKLTSDVIEEIVGHNRKLNLGCHGHLHLVRKALHKHGTFRSWYEEPFTSAGSFRFHKTAHIESRLSADKRIDDIRFGCNPWDSLWLGVCSCSELFHELWVDCFGMDVLDSSTIFGPLVVSHVGYDIAKDSGGVAHINFLREENETQ